MKVAIGPSSFADKSTRPLDMLKAAGCEIVPNPFGRRLTEEEIIEHLKNIDGLIAGLEPLNRKVLESAPGLKAIARVGIGMNNVDQDAAKELGIKVSNTPQGPTHAVAEMCLAALLAIGRNIVPCSNALHAKEWDKRIGFSIAGTKVLLVGYGRIGQRFGELLNFMGAELLVCDPFLKESNLKPGERLVGLEEGLAEAEVVSLHAGGVEEIIGQAQFGLMRDGAVLLNSARGELVGEAALVEALESGKVAGAWFDVFWQEPYQGPLCDYSQVLLTPHVSTYSKQCRLSMETGSVENLLRDLEIA